MNNITQIYQNAIKKSIKEKITNFSNDIVDAIIDSFNTGNLCNSKYVSVISAVQETERKAICKIIEETFEELDNNYKNSKERKKMYSVNKSKVSRTLTTIFGEICFQRTYYQSKFDDSYHFILDEALNLPQYDHYDPIVKSYCVDTYTKTNQSLAGKIVGNQISAINEIIDDNKIRAISRQSVHNWVNNWNTPEVELEPRQTPETLYIMVDEKFLGCQDKENDIMVKSYVVFENVVSVSKNRRKLVNRLVYNVQSEKPWEGFVDFLFKIYDSQKIKNIYILSDGANWITANISELKVEPNIYVKRLLCEFHFKQSINRITSVKEEREELLNKFKELSLNDFKAKIDEYIEKYSHKSEQIEKQKNYISNNYKAIKDMLNFNIGSSMESHISHIIAAPFASRPKGYSSKKIDKYLKINDYVNNGTNIFDLYLSSYNNEDDDETKNISVIKNKISTALKYASKIYRPTLLDNKLSYTRTALKELSTAK